MNLDDVLSAGKFRKRKRVGRGIGSGHGKTSTRGQKGAGARESTHGKIGFEGGQMPLFRRVPKRGFTNARFKTEYSVINVGDLGERFQANEEVSREILRERGLLKSGPARLKLLGDGELKVPLTIRVHAASKSALAKVEAAGGKVELVQ